MTNASKPNVINHYNLQHKCPIDNEVFEQVNDESHSSHWNAYFHMKKVHDVDYPLSCHSNCGMLDPSVVMR